MLTVVTTLDRHAVVENCTRFATISRPVRAIGPANARVALGLECSGQRLPQLEGATSSQRTHIVELDILAMYLRLTASPFRCYHGFIRPKPARAALGLG